MLNDVMLNQQQYNDEKEERLQAIKLLLIDNDGRLTDAEEYQINNRLIREYWSYSFDSTMAYVDVNLRLAQNSDNSEWTNKSNLDLALLMASSGHYKESQDVLLSIDKSGLSPTLRIEYYNCYRQIYSDLDYFSLQTESQLEYGDLYRSYTDSVAPMIEENEDDLLYAKEWELLAQNKFDESLKINSQRLSKTQMATEKYSYITFQRSLIYEQMEDRLLEKQFLALSAISDIKASRKDNAALAKLAFLTYEDGDVELAYQYISFSFEDAIFYNSKVRFVEIANSSSLILEAHQLATDKKNRSLRIFTVVLSVFFLVLLVLLYFVYKQKKTLELAKVELHKINEQYKALNVSLEKAMLELKSSYQHLSEANKVKELYIGNFMKIFSDFISKMDKNRLMVNKMLRSKKYQQLFDMTKTMEAIEEEVEIFYTTFDKTFLSLYPSFVDDLNELLLEDEQLTLKRVGNLNPELRIFALIRLGIKDSARIAELLRYSVNTIYNYRVKVKNMAKNRDTFENEVLTIGEFLMVE